MDNQPQSEPTSLGTAVKIAELGRDMKYVKEAVDKIDDKVSKGYVTKEEFDPIKRLVYGVVTLFTVAIVGGIMAILVRGGR